MKDRLDSLMEEYIEDNKGNREKDLKGIGTPRLQERKHFSTCSKRAVLSIALVLVLSLIVVMAILPFVSSECGVPNVSDIEDVPPIAKPSQNLGDNDKEMNVVPSTGSYQDICIGVFETKEEYYSYRKYMTLPDLDFFEIKGGLFLLITDSEQRVAGWDIRCGNCNYEGIFEIDIAKVEKGLTEGGYATNVNICTEILTLNGVDYRFKELISHQNCTSYLYIYEDGDYYYQIFVETYGEETPMEVLNLLYGE